MTKLLAELEKSAPSVFYLEIAGKLVQVLIIIVIGLIANFLLKKFIKRLLYKSPSKFDERKSRTIINLTSSILKYLIIIFVCIEILRTFGFEMSSLLTLAGLGGIAIGFGAQSIVKDIFTGVFVLLEDQYAVGDVVTLEGRTGTVESMGLRTTVIRTADGDVHIIPNGEIRIVTNMSSRFKRAVIDVEVSHNESLDKVLSVLDDEMTKASKDMPNISSKPTVLGVMAFTDKGSSIRIVAECSDDQFTVERTLRKRIKARFDQENISMATTQVTVQNG